MLGVDRPRPVQLLGEQHPHQRVGQREAGQPQRLAAWQLEAAPVAIVIGGPDGIAPELRAQADQTLRLSSLTLPHALVRVLLAEQLYRAWSINAQHPYHRE